ncbi:MAG: hypothetical protein WA843_04465, partial [Candidatus Saccharimonadales bacterium]
DLERKSSLVFEDQKRDLAQQMKDLQKKRADLSQKTAGKKKILQIDIVERLEDVLQYHDDCLLLKQWPGKWRSDFLS